MIIIIIIIIIILILRLFKLFTRLFPFSANKILYCRLKTLFTTILPNSMLFGKSKYF